MGAKPMTAPAYYRRRDVARIGPLNNENFALVIDGKNVPVKSVELQTIVNFASTDGELTFVCHDLELQRYFGKGVPFSVMIGSVWWVGTLFLKDGRMVGGTKSVVQCEYVGKVMNLNLTWRSASDTKIKFNYAYPRPSLIIRGCAIWCDHLRATLQTADVPRSDLLEGDVLLEGIGDGLEGLGEGYFGWHPLQLVSRDRKTRWRGEIKILSAWGGRAKAKVRGVHVTTSAVELVSGAATSESHPAVAYKHLHVAQHKKPGRLRRAWHLTKDAVRLARSWTRHKAASAWKRLTAPVVRMREETKALDLRRGMDGALDGYDPRRDA